MTTRLEDYGMIGDGQTAALVSRQGSVDWLCWPRFDSDACLAALLGRPKNGRWLIAPVQPGKATRRYQDDTLILETEHTTDDGVVRVVDFMPQRKDGSSVLIRQVTGLSGRVPMILDLSLRFDYGKIPPWTESTDDGFVARIGPDLVLLRAETRVEVTQGGACGEFIVAQGECLTFTLQHGSSCTRPPPPVDVVAALHATQRYWRDWIGHFDRPTHWPDAVRRSLITLRALIHEPSGGLVAAPTTSLPEKLGGSDNWDYRYTWLRDATFTISALLNAGYHEEAERWREWILRAVAGTPSELRILYRVDGGRHVNEWTVDWLDGYRWSRPVRIGNAAAAQRQIDVLGEVIDTLGVAAEAGVPVSAQEQAVAHAIAERIAGIWREGGRGVWESRGEPKQYTYSKVMAWVGLDRFIRNEKLHGDADTSMLRKLTHLREEIHREVCDEGFHPRLGSFVQHYGAQTLDASLLLIPLVGFLPADDPRIAGTIAAIERELMEDGLVRRKPPSGAVPEGAFLACSCWLADCRQMQGRHEEACEALERVLSVRNDLGLLSEEYDLGAGQLAGNFPQALSHLALVTSALGLSGKVLQRGGA